MSLIIMLLATNLVCALLTIANADSRIVHTLAANVPTSTKSTSDRQNLVSILEEKKNILLSNPEFIILDNESRIISSSLFAFWSDSLKQCGHIFICTEIFTTGWKDKTSLQISTTTNNVSMWSYISGKGIDVKPNELYEVVTHMKLNNFARQSHIVIEGLNETEQEWSEITPFCPENTDGPLEWHEFSCVITIPEGITQIRPILYAGYSSQQGKEAKTLFDSIYMIKLTEPIITDPKLKMEQVFEGLERPTSMALLGPDDILVLEHYKGTVQRIVNGVMLPQPLLDANVAAREGMLGIAVAKNISLSGSHPTTYVFLYYTEAKDEDHEDDNHTIGNRLYRYELAQNGSKLINPKLLLNIPVGATHNGGPVVIGPDKNVYLAVGELGYVDQLPPLRNKAVNYNNGQDPNGVSGILRVTMDGKPVAGILGSTSPLNLYYGYGIRNSFGMDFDPLTKKLWLTDNGPDFGDEIDLVEPGFNGGWAYISGTMRMANDSNYKGYPLPTSLEDFDGKGKYSDPKFTWNHTVGPTGLKFLTSDKYGKEYENDIFVGDVNNGRIYHFDLNNNRTELSLPSPLADKVATSDDQLQSLIFAKGFQSAHPDVTDLQVGPDGYLYVVAMDQGKIFKVVPRAPFDNPYRLESLIDEFLTLPSGRVNETINNNGR